MKTKTKVVSQKDIPRVAVPTVARTTKASAVKRSPGKKPVAKKSPSKTRRPKAAVPKVSLRHRTVAPVAPDEKKFWLHSGEALATLQELATSFALMDAVVYRHHVNQHKNDFAAWVEHVLADPICAEALRRVKTPRSARLVIVRHLKRYDG
jgi:hypothetical protein